MQLTVFNGSPRGKNSNTRLLLERFLSGFEGKGGQTKRLHYLVKRNQRKEQVDDFALGQDPRQNLVPPGQVQLLRRIDLRPSFPDAEAEVGTGGGQLPADRRRGEARSM